MTKWWSGAGPRSKVSAVIAGVLVLIGIYLCVLAVGPGLRPDGWAGWFGEPGSWPTALIVVALAGLAVWLRLSESGRRTAGSAVTLVAATGGVSLVLGLASFWRCPTDQVPGVGSLASTLALFVAGGRAPADGSAACMQSPVAYDLARAGGVLVVLTLLAGVVYTVFRPQFDRAAIRFAKSLTVVDGIDDLGALAGIAATARESGSTLVLIDHGTHPDAVRMARSAGARITTDPDPAGTLSALHLLSADTQTNLVRLAGHDAAMGDPDSPVPVSIRIDDPWQAEMWRRSQPVFDPVRWQPEVISRYEATAGRIADDLATKAPTTVYVCGTSQLTFAVCVAAGRIPAAEGRRVPRLCVVAPDGTGFAADVTAFTGPRGKGAATISSIDADPSIEKLTGLITARGGDCAIVLAEDADAAAAIRLAIRYPAVPIYRVTPTRSASAERTPAETAPHTAGLITMPLALL
ncbi:hypothetical protein [Gordonia sp. (in: high G+C Gram-positive bacteria)]|jgi:hypothetical protein|uniref:hypothetical protein n=1 Tax=Gordonia sp. (in: high G+C Gram-positive bacteria) TaxID=84139 RepID=UPI001D7BF984|nr:hypothetical protein [Gordonia sp. (in: high G+C Gram-positive bacteria)]MCB1295758.1 hypothetical protein [Gordonia sp. (in: high G+C Gram-positive bacteria)]HMS74999.1 hypothetical protein [Gordonia sp. (in: high G+C Gram-positive bacteria)]